MAAIVSGWIAIALLISLIFLSTFDRLALRGFGLLIGKVIHPKRIAPSVPGTRIAIWGALIAAVIATGITIIASARPVERLSNLGALTFCLLALWVLTAFFTTARRADLRIAASKGADVQREASIDSTAPRSEGGPKTASSARAIYALAAVILLVAFVGFAFLVPIDTCKNCAGIGKLQAGSQTLMVCGGCGGNGRRTLWDMVR